MTTTKRICVLNGPNLNLLGVREPELYGTQTLQEIVDKLLTIADEKKCTLVHFQSNHEGALIDFLHDEYIQCLKNPTLSFALIVNLAAYSHTSIALLDALNLFAKKNCPIYEVHLTNIYNREIFRHHSFVSKIATDVIMDLGGSGYEMALHKILDYFDGQHTSGKCT